MLLRGSLYQLGEEGGTAETEQYKNSWEFFVILIGNAKRLARSDLASRTEKPATVERATKSTSVRRYSWGCDHR